MAGISRSRSTAGRMLGSGFLAIVVAGGSLAMVTPAAAAGKPGYPTTVQWGGKTWQVKTSNAAVGPGPNIFAASNVSVDPSNGWIHLKIAKNASGKWTCAEIIGPTSYGYGTYTFTVESPLNALDRNAVLGLFTWSDKAPYAHREIDVEFAKWGSTTDTTNGQYVVQPYNLANHLVRFTQDGLAHSVQSFTWSAGSITWRTTTSGGATYGYTYTGADVPKPGDERVHLNLWLFQGAAPANNLPVDIALSSFSYTP